MDRSTKSHRRVGPWLLVLAAAALIATGIVHSVRASSSPFHASQYWLRFSCYGNCSCSQLPQVSAYFPTVGSRTVALNNEQGCVSGPDLQKGGTIEVKIKSGGTVVLSGTIQMDDNAQNRHTLGTHDGVTYTTYCQTGAVDCGGGVKDTWFPEVEATCN